MLIAIDGPAGSGKSAVARRIAMHFGLEYLDTGAMYRSVALLASEEGASMNDVKSIADMARRIQIEFSPLSPDFQQKVWLNGKERTSDIRRPEVSQATSRIAAIPELRQIMADRQREMAHQAGNAILEGRDIGTVVLPDADIKIYLTASPEERARRRTIELNEQAESEENDRVLAEQKERDVRDSSRSASPLRAAEDAIHINSDGMDIESVVDRITALIKEKERAI